MGRRHAAARNRARARAGAGQEARASTSCAPRSPSRIGVPRWKSPSCSGADAEKALRCRGATVFVDPRLPELGVRVLGAGGQAAALLAARGCTEAPLAAYDALRLELGVPDGSRDLPSRRRCCWRSGFDELNGVDWQKGCYMGQELTARTKYRGLVKKRLFPVQARRPAARARHGDHTRRPGGRRDPLGLGRSRAGDAAARCASKAGATLTAGDAGIVPEIPAWMRLPETVDPVAGPLAPGLRSPPRHTRRRRCRPWQLEADQSQPLHHPPRDRRHLRRRDLDPLDRHRASAWASSSAAATPSTPPSPPPSPCRSSSRISAARAATCR